MGIRISHAFTLAILATPLALAQQGRIAGPVAGFVFDGSARAVRPVLGIPGASVMGDALSFGMDLSSASVSPRLDSVVAVATDGRTHIFRLNSGAVSEVAVNGITVTTERVAFSPSGTAVALYGGGKVQLIAGLPDAPVVTATLDAPRTQAPRGHRYSAGEFAVSDDGAYALFVAGNTVQVLGAGGARKLPNGRATIVAFAPGAHDAAMVDPRGAGLVFVKDVAGAADMSTLASPDDAMQSAAGVAFSGDGKKLFIASPGTRSVTALDVAAGTRSSIKCACNPVGITAMGSLFRLNEAGVDPLWLLDAAAAEPRIVFVPAGASAN